MTRNGNQGHVTCSIRSIRSIRSVTYLTYLIYLTYKRGFLRSIVVYLKDLSPYYR